MNPVESSKVASTIIVFVITVLFGGMPVGIMRCLRGRCERTAAIISYLNCLAGGVFLGTAMLHLLAESEEQLKTALINSRPNSTAAEYPLAEVAISGGFFFILIMEVVVLRVMHGVGRGPGESGNKARRFVNGDEHKRLLDINNAGTEELHRGETVEESLSASGVHEEVREIIKEKPSMFRAVVLVLALSLHMIFEGLAIGLQESESSVWTLMAAVSLHKCIVAFSVGLQMKQILRSTCKFSAFIVLFAVIASLGIPIGLAVTDGYSEDSLVLGLLQSVATGTFFYVTFFEILQREFTHSHNLLKLSLCLLGYGAVAVLKLLDKD